MQRFQCAAAKVMIAGAPGCGKGTQCAKIVEKVCARMLTGFCQRRKHPRLAATAQRSVLANLMSMFFSTSRSLVLVAHTHGES